jgi:hypothetical protein
MLMDVTQKNNTEQRVEQDPFRTRRAGRSSRVFFFGGGMIRSPAFYRVFVLLEFRRTKRTNFLKDVGMVSVNPKRHKHPGGVTTALAVVHVLESDVHGATAP